VREGQQVRKNLNALLSLLMMGLTIAASAVFAQAPADGTAAPATPGAPGAAGAKAPKQLEALSEELFLRGLMDPFDYEPRGRKDPFAQPVLDRPVAQGSTHGPLLPLQRFELAKLKLIGIIWDVKRPRAMINDPENKVHIVGPNTKIGLRNGYIAVIREGEIVIVETVEENGRLVSSAQIVKLAK
jgi:type IV pilus assembly protein PilP